MAVRLEKPPTVVREIKWNNWCISRSIFDPYPCEFYYYETVLIRFMVGLICLILLNYMKLKATVICENGREYTMVTPSWWLIDRWFILKTHRRQNNNCGSNCHCLRWSWIVPLNDTDSIDQVFTLLWWNHWDWDCLRKVSGHSFLIHFFVKCFLNRPLKAQQFLIQSQFLIEQVIVVFGLSWNMFVPDRYLLCQLYLSWSISLHQIFCKLWFHI